MRADMVCFVVMGVAGCGKSTVAQALAKHLGVNYMEGDTLHDSSNVEKMSRGEALTDDDRWPWLQRIGQCLADNEGAMVISCSALRRVYRDRITQFAAKPVLFIHLAADQSVIAERMASRSGHFMPVSLLDSQYLALEPLQQDEPGTTIDISQSLETVMEDVIVYLKGQV